MKDFSILSVKEMLRKHLGTRLNREFLYVLIFCMWEQLKVAKIKRRLMNHTNQKVKKNCSLCQITRCVIDHSSKLKEVRVESSHTLFDQGWCVSKFWYPENDLKPNSKKLYFMKMLSLIELGFGNFHFFVICFFFICNFEPLLKR